jgi:hypothetical protein
VTFPQNGHSAGGGVGTMAETRASVVIGITQALAAALIPRPEGEPAILAPFQFPIARHSGHHSQRSSAVCSLIRLFPVVQVGVSGDPNSSYPCLRQNANATRVVCELNPADIVTSARMVFSVHVHGLDVVGTETISFAVRPVLDSVTGCTTVNGKAVDCPTAGGVQLTLTGSHFLDPVEVSIGGKLCTSPVPTGHTSIVCALEEGTGSNLEVLVRNLLSSYTSTLLALTFAAPEITEINGGGCVKAGLHSTPPPLHSSPLTPLRPIPLHPKLHSTLHFSTLHHTTPHHSTPLHHFSRLQHRCPQLLAQCGRSTSDADGHQLCVCWRHGPGWQSRL